MSLLGFARGRNMRRLASSENSFTQLPRLLLACPVTTSCLTLNIHRSFSWSQHRHFLNRSRLDSLFAASTPLRQLTHTRVIPYPRSTVFDAIASVDKYPSFLPFVVSATICERDHNKRPTSANLKVGYDALGIEETWASVVNADEEHGTIEASAADTGQGKDEGLFEVLKTKWHLRDLEDIRRQGVGVGVQTAVRLDVEVKFRNAMYDKLFAGVEEKVAGAMVGAFEKRIREATES